MHFEAEDLERTPAAGPHGAPCPAARGVGGHGRR